MISKISKPDPGHFHIKMTEKAQPLWKSKQVSRDSRKYAERAKEEDNFYPKRRIVYSYSN